MNRSVVVLGLIGLFFAAPFARAQDFRLDNPALFRPSTLPSIFNNETVLNSASLGWTSAPLGQSLSAPQSSLSFRPQNQSVVDRLLSSVPKPSYVSGEVGFLYGAGIGKHSGSFNEEYIIGEVGNDHLHITVGAAREESTFNLGRQRW